MNVNRLLLACLMPLLVMTTAAAADTADIRAVYRQLEQQRAQSDQHKMQRDGIIRRERATLRQDLEALQQDVAALERKVAAQQQELEQKQAEVVRLDAQQTGDRELMTNLAAAVRVSAKQLQDLTLRSPYTALDPGRPEQLDPVLNSEHFPGLDDMQLIADQFFAEMRHTGQVMRPNMVYTDRGGREYQGNILLVGPFMAVHNENGKGQVLLYNPVGRHLAEVAFSLPWGLQRSLDRYLKGESDSVPMDLALGSAIEQLARQKTFFEKVEAGGFLSWPILGLGLIAALIGVERGIFLKRVHDRTDLLMDEVNRNAEDGNWSLCRKLVEGRKSPVCNVIRAGLSARHENREVLESILQEAILKELPRLERALPMLNIMGAVAPLMGLLGTVVGMIGTFEVITIHGTGDPRLMSGGISLALVTTMLGLMVAIPIMLLHTFLSRKVEHVIGDMEEKSVSLINTIQRYRLPGA